MSAALCAVALAGEPATVSVASISACTWRPTPLAAVGGALPQMRSVTAISPTEVWAVGDSQGRLVIEHFDGANWSVVQDGSAIPHRADLQRVQAITSDMVYAVGVRLDHQRRRLFAERFDGAAWTVIRRPPGEVFDNGVMAIAVDAKSGLWVGGSGIDTSSMSRGFVDRFNGRGWRSIPVPADRTAVLALAAPTPTDVWAGMFQGLSPVSDIQRWDGATWSSAGNPMGLDNVVEGMYAGSKSRIWAVGGTGSSPEFAAASRYRHGAWSAVPVELPRHATESLLWSVAASVTGGVWAVGEYDGKPLIEGWNGHRFVIVPPGVSGSGSLHSVAVAPSTGVAFAVGPHTAVECS